MVRGYDAIGRAVSVAFSGLSGVVGGAGVANAVAAAAAETGTGPRVNWERR